MIKEENINAQNSFHIRRPLNFFHYFNIEKWLDGKNDNKIIKNWIKGASSKIYLFMHQFSRFKTSSGFANWYQISRVSAWNSCLCLKVQWVLTSPVQAGRGKTFQGEFSPCVRIELETLLKEKMHPQSRVDFYSSWKLL